MIQNSSFLLESNENILKDWSILLYLFGANVLLQQIYVFRKEQLFTIIMSGDFTGLPELGHHLGFVVVQGNRSKEFQALLNGIAVAKTKHVSISRFICKTLQNVYI